MTELFDLLSHVSAEDWVKDALCAQTDPDMFFPEPGRVAADAKQICAACDVREQCLAYALEHREREGIWGGKTPKQRSRMPRPRICRNCGKRVTDSGVFCSDECRTAARAASKRAYERKQAA